MCPSGRSYPNRKGNYRNSWRARTCLFRAPPRMLLVLMLSSINAGPHQTYCDYPQGFGAPAFPSASCTLRAYVGSPFIFDFVQEKRVTVRHSFRKPLRAKPCSSLFHIFGISYSEKSYKHPTVQFIFLVFRDVIRNKHPVCPRLWSNEEVIRTGKLVLATGWLAGGGRRYRRTRGGETKQPEVQDGRLLRHMCILPTWFVCTLEHSIPKHSNACPSLSTHLLLVLLGDVFLG